MKNINIFLGNLVSKRLIEINLEYKLLSSQIFSS